jgi:hypothetical protein
MLPNPELKEVLEQLAQMPSGLSIKGLKLVILLIVLVREGLVHII